MIYTSPIGKLYIDVSGDRITGICIEGQKCVKARETVIHSNEADEDTVRTVTRWLDAYFSGERPDPLLLHLELRGSEFQKVVWNSLLAIPYGQTLAYSQLAKAAASAMGKSVISAQAVGQAVGKNPVSIVIPCHRVIGINGRLTGYAAGIERKRWLLLHEGAEFKED